LTGTHLRNLQFQDVGELLSILQQWPQNDLGLGSWSARTLSETLENSIDNECVGIEDEQGLVCFAVLRRLPGAREVLVLATARRAARQGFMSQLLLHLKAARKPGEELWLEVHEGNHNARSLYEKLGFQMVGQRPAYYPDGRAAMLYNLR